MRYHIKRKVKSPGQLALLIGWQGSDLSLLRQALTHPTYFEGHQGADNQRLEYLGDGVLDMLMAEELYHRYPNFQEGELSKLRAALVCQDALAAAAKKLELGDYVLLGHGGEKNGDYLLPSVLSDAFEAVLGALYLTSGLEAARRLLLSLMEQEIANSEALKKEDSKGLLQQRLQSQGHPFPTYQLLESKGPDHRKEYKMGAYCSGQLLGEGWGSSKKEASQAAAADALKKLAEGGMENGES